MSFATTGLVRRNSRSPQQKNTVRTRRSPQDPSSSRSDAVRAAQEQSTQVWLADLRQLLDRAQERFADISWVTPHTSHSSNQNNEQGSSSDSDPLIWAHKAILYARASHTFQTKFLHLKPPIDQLESLATRQNHVYLPSHNAQSRDSVESTETSSKSYISRKTIRGAAPPSSFSLGSKRRSSARQSISNSVISRPYRNGSTDDASSCISGFMTSDSENEGSSTKLPNRMSTTSTSINPATCVTHSNARQRPSIPSRKPSFTPSDDSGPATTGASLSEQGPLLLESVDTSSFRSMLEYLYTGQQMDPDTIEFLLDDKLILDGGKTSEQKTEKMRADFTYMWRSKLFSDVKICLDNGSIISKTGSDMHLMDIPDAGLSLISLPQTLDTEGQSEEEDDEMTSFSAHRMILASRSPYFASLLLSPYSDSNAPVLRLPSPPFTPASLHFTLGYIYTGTLFFSGRTFDLSTAFAIWRAGAYLQIAILQNFVSTLIDREFCHGFTCSPPCRKCIKRVPRTLLFAVSPDVSELALQEASLHAIAGPDFGLFWGKEIGNLDSEVQHTIVEKISTRLQADPPAVVSVLRQLSIVRQRIDTERSSHWVESLRSMAETIEHRLVAVLHSSLEQIVTSKPWSDLLDGVGSLGDVLEKCLVILLEGLTEARAAKVYEILVGHVLLRDQGLEDFATRQAVEKTRSGILRYLKKRWINIRALSGFNTLPKWCLKEIADELDVTTADLLLPEDPKTPTAPKTRLTPLIRSSLAGSGAGVPSARRTSSTSGLTSWQTGTNATPRTSAPSSSLDGTRTPMARRRVEAPRDESEREAGPIHLRASVLNRNAARTSVLNGHRASNSLALGVAAVSLPKRSSSIESKPSSMRQPLQQRDTQAGAASVERNPSETPIRSLSEDTSSHDRNAATAIPVSSSKDAARRSDPSDSVAGSIPKVRSQQPQTTQSKPADHAQASGSSLKANSTAHSSPSLRTKSNPPSPASRKLTMEDRDKTPTRSIRSRTSNISLPKTEIPSMPKVSVATTSSTNTAKVKRVPPSLAAASVKTAAIGSETNAASGSKSAFLRATPGPGGTFSLSTTDSGHDVRARTINGTQGRDASPALKPPTTTLKPRRSLLALGVGKNPMPATPSSIKSNPVQTSIGSLQETSTVKQKRVLRSGAASMIQVSPTSSFKAGSRQQLAPLTATTRSQSPGTTQDSEYASTRAEYGLITPSTSTETMLIHRSPHDQRPRSLDASVSPELSDGDGQPNEATGVTLYQPIPCIVCPQASANSASATASEKRTPSTLGESLGTSRGSANAQHRFSASVKYIGTVQGHEGLWVGLEVPLPLPSFLLDRNKIRDDDVEMVGSDGKVDGKHYFDLTHHWDVLHEDVLASQTRSADGSRASSATYADTVSGRVLKKRQHFRYPESQHRRDRRRKIYQMATVVDNDERSDSDANVSTATPTSIGMFVRPKDILLVVGGW